jgi:hypothetical protein
LRPATVTDTTKGNFRLGVHRFRPPERLFRRRQRINLLQSYDSTTLTAIGQGAYQCPLSWFFVAISLGKWVFSNTLCPSLLCWIPDVLPKTIRVPSFNPDSIVIPLSSLISSQRPAQRWQLKLQEAKHAVSNRIPLRSNAKCAPLCLAGVCVIWLMVLPLLLQN